MRDECGRFGRVKLILIPKLSDYPSLKREYDKRKKVAVEEFRAQQEYIRNVESEFEKPKKKRKKHRHAQRAAEEPQVEPIVPVDGFLRRAADCELLIEPRKKDELHLETELGIGKIFVEFDDHFEAAEALKVGSLPLT